MRVITGIARGRKLLSPEGLDVRPTTERVKEAVFSTIHFEIEGACVLDLFCGSGQMGIEALSRGAAKAYFVDNSSTSQNLTKRNLTATKLIKSANILCMDALQFLKTTQEMFDIAFLDPPYQKEFLPPVLELLSTKMRSSGVILCESNKGEELPSRVNDFCIFKEYFYGNTKITAYRIPKLEE